MRALWERSAMESGVRRSGRSANMVSMEPAEVGEEQGEVKSSVLAMISADQAVEEAPVDALPSAVLAV